LIRHNITIDAITLAFIEIIVLPDAIFQADFRRLFHAIDADAADNITPICHYFRFRRHARSLSRHYAAAIDFPPLLRHAYAVATR
jgi:hypothetical protein